jgi:hypothetical protein
MHYVLALSALVLSGAALSSCSRNREPPAEAVAAYQKALSHYDTLADQLAQSVAYLGQPLQSLSEQQQASIAALLILTRVTAQAEAVRPADAKGALEAVWGRMADVCPPVRSVSFSRGGCLDQSIAYAGAMARCLKEGKSESECEKLSAPEGAAEIACVMRQLEGLQGVIGGLPGRRWPPAPFPWPIDTGPIVRVPSH